MDNEVGCKVSRQHIYRQRYGRRILFMVDVAVNLENLICFRQGE